MIYDAMNFFFLKIALEYMIVGMDYPHDGDLSTSKQRT